MSPETRKALEDSIAHWERMTADPSCGERPYRSECALCDRFYDTKSDTCGDCPVALAADSNCNKTPYQNAASDWWDVVNIDKPYTPKRRAAMQAEVDFLKSLLPEDDQ